MQSSALGPPPSSQLVKRQIKVTLLLATLGAVSGVVVGTILGALFFASGPDGPSNLDIPLGFYFGGSVGGIFGAVAAPLAGWLGLRRVPIGRAILITAASTILASGAGIALRWHPILLAFAGFLLGVLAARATSKPREAV